MNKKLFAKLFALVLAMCVVFSIAIIVSSAADNEALVAKFELGANGSASHSDGSSKTSYTETVGDYQLSLTGGSQMYTGARDEKGNSCIKFGSSKNTGSTSFTVPNDVTKVIIYVAKYKANTSKVTVNGTTYTLSGASNNGVYDAITVDTTTTKKVSFSTASGGVRAMVNTIEFYAAVAETGCQHTNTTTNTVPATCTTDGSVSVVCTDCEFAVSYETITATGHTGGTATCTAKAVCETCSEEYGKLLDHNFENGVCTECDMEEPSELTIDFTTKDQRVSLDSNAQVWKNGNLIFTNNKASSTNAVADYANPVRLYKGSTITIDCEYNIYKITFNVNTSESKYLTALTTSVGSNGSASGNVVTVTLDGSSNTYTVALSDQVRLNSLTAYYITDNSDVEVCDHEGTEKTTNTVGATCHKDGSVTVTCECGAVVSSETIPATGHKMTNGICSGCGLVEAPATNVPYKFGMYQGNLGTTHYIVGGMSNTHYFATGTDAAAGLNVYLEETEGGYYLYTFVNGAKTYINMIVNGTYVNGVYETTASTVYTYNTEKKLLTASVNDETYAFGTRSDKTFNTVGPVTATGNFYCEFYAAGDVDRINSAGVVLGTTLGMNFAVTVPAGTPTMTVEFAGKTYELIATKTGETTYKFSFKGIGPHQMAENIKATLYVDGKAVAEIGKYSIEENLKAILALDPSLAGIVNAVLAYGDASENYNKIEGGVTAPETETEVEITEENNKLDLENADDFGFTAAGVNFDSDNKIYVKFYVVGEFKFFVNGEEVAIEKTEDGYYKFYTEALTATQFDDTFTFEIEVNGVKATLVYSVNSYAYAMQNDADMGELAKALYVYGVAAEDYAN